MFFVFPIGLCPMDPAIALWFGVSQDWGGLGGSEDSLQGASGRNSKSMTLGAGKTWELEPWDHGSHIFYRVLMAFPIEFR